MSSLFLWLGIGQPQDLEQTHDHHDKIGIRFRARVTEDLDGCSVVFGIKEMPVEFFAEGRTYVFFTHTHKGQAKNMAMLRALMARRCQLIDYERIVDDQQKRLLFFGQYAGLAGMIAPPQIPLRER